MWESLLTKLGIDTVKSGIKSAGKRLSKREYAELISEAIRELLKLHPDISGAEARILAAEALGLPPSTDLLSARQLLKAAKKERKKDGKRKAKKKAGKKAAKKKGKKKATKKKVTRTHRKKSKRGAGKKSRRSARAKAPRRR